MILKKIFGFDNFTAFQISKLRKKLKVKILADPNL